MNYPDLLLYWIKERYAILKKKEQGLPAPWSEDPVFQSTYFCNVRREDDKVTKYIRAIYSQFVSHPLFEYNMVLARFLNRPDTLEAIGHFQQVHQPGVICARLRQRADFGYPIWGNAYVITTHGQKMDKLAYLAQVLDAVHEQLPNIRAATQPTITRALPTCLGASMALQMVNGIGSFLAGQIVADLKNTINHPLHSAADRDTFVVPGPGSLRGASWFHWERPDKMTPAAFLPSGFGLIRRHVDKNWPQEVPPIDNQDLQNCLCEFDKYCRVKNGTGRSKRKYAGTG